MTTAEALSKPFSIGTVFQKTFDVIGKAFVPIFFVTALMNMPNFLLGIEANSLRSAGGSATTVVGIVNILTFLLQIIAEGILVFGAFRVLQGNNFDLGTSFGLAMRRAFTLLGLAIIWGIAIGIGFIALIIPGLIVATMYMVAVPACLVESRGIFSSLKRSQLLTKGYRWQVFGVYFLLSIGAIAAGLALGAAVGFTAGLGAIGRIYASAIAQLIVGTISGGIQAVMVAVIYSELRYVKEGVGIDEIADVFA